jgi:hypothetical protein
VSEWDNGYAVGFFVGVILTGILIFILKELAV